MIEPVQQAEASVRVLRGDCLQRLKELPDNSIDSCVTDPPAGINFMNKPFDSDRGGRDQWIAWLEEIMVEALRVAKPGAHAFVWALPRTSHWTATALENAGWEIRDVCHHIFGSGFPKSKNLGNGWGTALKPAVENWILCRAPLSEKSATANFARWGTGGLNIDSSRVGSEEIESGRNGRKECESEAYGKKLMGNNGGTTTGRFPANLIISHHPDCRLISGSQAGTMRVCQEHDTASPVSIAEQSDIPSKPHSSDSATMNVEGSQDAEELTTLLSSPIKRDMSDSNIGTMDSASTFTNSSTDECGEKQGEKSRMDTSSTILAKTSRTIDSKISNSCPEGRTDASITETTINTPTNLPHQITQNGGGKTTQNTRPFTQQENESDAASARWECVEGCPVDKIGEPARFFKTFPGFYYSPKASKRERSANGTVENNHPTVKSLPLMKYLVRLVSSPGSTVLDPFCGSGTTGVACAELGHNFIGIEQDESYADIAEARCAHALNERAEEFSGRLPL